MTDYTEALPTREELERLLDGITPGEWAADNNEGYSIWRIVGSRDVYGGGRSIAEVIGDSGETDCNAALIAAAPRLARALLRLMEERDGMVLMPRTPSPEMKLRGARSIGETMSFPNHTERASECWNAMIGLVNPSKPVPLPRPLAIDALPKTPESRRTIEKARHLRPRKSKPMRARKRWKDSDEATAQPTSESPAV